MPSSVVKRQRQVSPRVFHPLPSTTTATKMLASFAAFVALLPFTLAQGNPALQVESIDAQFQAAYIVPDLLKSFDPVAYLTLGYGGNEVAPGSPLTVQRQF